MTHAARQSAGGGVLAWGYTAITGGGHILAWGDNNVGQLGADPNSIHQSDVPVRVPLPAGFTATAIGAGLAAGTALAIGHQIRD